MVNHSRQITKHFGDIRRIYVR